MHLQIIRQKEKKLNFDISLDSFLDNLENIEKPSEKILKINAGQTNIPWPVNEKSSIFITNYYLKNY